MSTKNRAIFEPLKSAAHTAIGASYAALGTPLSAPAVVLSFKNQTNGDVLVSTDGTNDMLIIPSNSFNIFDVRTNSPINTDLMFAQGTQFYVKDGTSAPSAGSFYMESIVIQQVS